MDVSQAGTFKLGQTELKGKKKKDIQNKALHAMKFGTILNHKKAMNERMAFTSTNTLTFSLIYLTDGSILPQQGEDLGREALKTITLKFLELDFQKLASIFVTSEANLEIKPLISFVAVAKNARKP